MSDLQGKTSLITGASSGLGVAFARQLAARGSHVVLVARRTDRLEALAREIEQTHKVRAVTLTCDLARPGAAAALIERLHSRKLEIDVLVNNAGRGVHETLADTEANIVAEQIQLNVTTLVELTHALAIEMRKRGAGHILNVASVGAYLPVPGYATYAAAKAFVRNFSEAVAHELSGTGVRVCCLCPGGIDTEFFQAAGQSVSWWMKLGLMSPERCARIGLSALFSWRSNVVSGMTNKLGMFMLRFLPRWITVVVAAAVMGKQQALPTPRAA